MDRDASSTPPSTETQSKETLPTETPSTETEAESQAVEPGKRTMWGTVRVVLKRSSLAAASLFGLYLVTLLIGLIPVNNGFKPTEDGVRIYVISNAVHADIVVPISHQALDWRTEFPADMFRGDTSWATHVAFGWGDRGFYVDTPTWGDLKLSTAAKALLTPSECCLHVQLMQMEGREDIAHSVRLSNEQYEELIRFLKRSLKTDASGDKLQIPDAAYGWNDAFFVAPGNYHALNTCNSWVGHALRTTGVRAPLLSPLPGTPTMYLPQASAVSPAN